MADGTRQVLAGHYDDTYRRTPEGWRFTSRRLTKYYAGPPDLLGEFFVDRRRARTGASDLGAAGTGRRVLEHVLGIEPDPRGRAGPRSRPGRACRGGARTLPGCSALSGRTRAASAG